MNKDYEKIRGFAFFTLHEIVRETFRAAYIDACNMNAPNGYDDNCEAEMSIAANEYMKAFSEQHVER